MVCDQIGTPTFAGDLAKAIHTILRHDRWVPGIYHFTDEGVASWYDFSKAIFELAGKNVEVTPVPSSEYPTPAKRPFYSVLSKNKIKRLSAWKSPTGATRLSVVSNFSGRKRTSIKTIPIENV